MNSNPINIDDIIEFIKKLIVFSITLFGSSFSLSYSPFINSEIEMSSSLVNGINNS